MISGRFVKTQRPGFRVEGRIGDADAVEFENSYLIEQGSRKIRPHEGLLVLTERLSGAEITLVLIAQIGRDPGDSLLDAFVGQFGDWLGICLCAGDFVFYGCVIFAEGVCRL